MFRMFFRREFLLIFSLGLVLMLIGCPVGSGFLEEDPNPEDEPSSDDQISSIGVTPEKLVIKEGSKGQLSAEIKKKDGTSSICNNDTNDKPGETGCSFVGWFCEDSNIASPQVDGTIDGVEEGSTTCSAVSIENDGVKGTSNVRVIGISSVDVETESVFLTENGTDPLTITKTYSDESNEICTEGAESECDDLSGSCDNDLAEFSDDFVLTGNIVGAGECTVSSKADPNIFKKFDVTVNPTLEIIAEKTMIFAGEKIILKTNFTSEDVFTHLTWTVHEIVNGNTNAPLEPADVTSSVLSSNSGDVVFTGPPVDEPRNYIVDVQLFQQFPEALSIPKLLASSTITIMVKPIIPTPQAPTVTDITATLSTDDPINIDLTVSCTGTIGFSDGSLQVCSEFDNSGCGLVTPSCSDTK